MVRERRQRGAVDEDFRIAQLGGRGVAQVERHDLPFGQPIQDRRAQLEACQVGAQARQAFSGGFPPHREAGLAQQTLLRQIGGNGAAHKTGRAGDQNTHA